MRKHEAADASDDGKQHRLGNHLPNEAPSVGSERMPHGKLSPPRFSIRNQQRSQIHADNQQHEEDGAGEKNQRVALIADDILMQRPDDGEMSLRVMIGRSEER